ncbi:MAG TPA: HAD family hydrolase [Clostridiales bacterium]|nr:HAD family hydrolase [Clostridiales bacterium]
MLDTFLFDLDGTLLPLDMDDFIKCYFTEIGRYFEDMIDAQKMINHVWTGTKAMVTNREEKTNQQVFMNTFKNLIDGNLDVYQERFDRFYDEGFLKVQNCTRPCSLVKEAIAVLKKKKYTLAVATNPLFPRKAILHRIHWAGLDPDDFVYISSYEYNHYCKPHLEFYIEVLESLQKQPEQCMMVGNDVKDDLVASKLGIQTYLITDYVLNRCQLPVECTHQGSYKDFYQFACDLPEVGC